MLDGNGEKVATIARIWRGRVRSERADEYADYLRSVGVTPLLEKALGAQMFREDRPGETEFITISYWESIAAMSRFAWASSLSRICVSPSSRCARSSRR